MKNRFVKALSLVLCLATLISACALLFSCSDNNKVKEEKKTVIIENGVSEYTLIRPDKLDQRTLDLIIGLRNTIVDASGCNILFATDWVKSEADIDENAKEILVGNTNRAQTKEVLDSLEPNSWAVVDTGNKIVICANNDALLSVAIDWFVKNCVNEADKTVSITEKLVKKDGFGNNLPISISGASSYQIVYPKGNEQLEYYASLIQRKSSVETVVSDESEESAFEIVVGDTNRAENPSFSADNQYSIKTENSKVYINASNENVLYYAVNYYIEYAMSVNESIVSVPADYSKTGDIASKYYASSWGLNIPYIEEGKIAKVYNIGTGLADDREKDTVYDSYMHLVSEVEYSAFENYAKKLESFGFKKIYNSKTENNDLWGYRLGGAYAYIHYTPSQKYIRVIWDKSSNCEVADIEYVQKQTGTTTFYQYSLDYTGAKLNMSGNGLNCGMLYFIKLQDNSLIMIDSGSESQASEEALKGLCDFIYEQTGTTKNDPLKIRFWYFTHSDGDHMGLAYKLLEYIKTHGYKPAEIEAIGHNHPNARGNSTLSKTGPSYKMIEYVQKNYPDVKYIKLHTGMVFNIGEVKLEVLGTFENIVNTKGGIMGEWDTNDTCTVLRFFIGKKSILMCGDIANDKSVLPYHMNLYSTKYYKSDILQVSHHGYNLLPALYDACAPEYALISNAIENVKNRTEQYQYYNKLVSATNRHYAGDYTTALAILGDKITTTKYARYDSPAKK